MSEHAEEQRIPKLEALKAPARSDLQRQRLRERILARAEPLLARRRPSYWEVLAGWARPGLAAAAVGALLLLGALRIWGGPASIPATALDDLLRQAGDGTPVPTLLVAASEPDANAIVEAALLERGSAAAGVGDNRNDGRNR